MSDHGSYPPPGSTPSGPSSGPWGAAPPPQGPGRTPPPHVPPQLRGAAHKPGAIALRPLRLGDIYDSAFRIIRYNPRATVGAAVIVSLVAMALPVVVSLVVGLSGDTSSVWSGESAPSTQELVGLVVAVGSLMLGVVTLQLGTILVTGVIAHVTHAAATGRKIGLAQAWAATLGKRWRLVGLALVSFLAYLVLVALVVGAVALLVVSGAGTAASIILGIVLGILLAVAMVWLYTRCFYLAPAALVLEEVGVLGSVARAYRLTRQQFWRTFGIGLLTGIIAAIAGTVLTIPITVLGEVLDAVAPDQALVTFVLVQALSTVISSAFTIPFIAGVTTVQYLDQRIRKEAYDVELMQQAGITGA